MLDFTTPGSPLKRRLKFSGIEGLVMETSQPNMHRCIEVNKALLNRDRPTSQLRPGESWALVARIPLWLIEKWRVEEGVDFFNPDHQDAIAKKINDFHTYGDLRTAPGRV